MRLVVLVELLEHASEAAIFLMLDCNLDLLACSVDFGNDVYESALRDQVFNLLANRFRD